jgi:hypothetical protein
VRARAFEPGGCGVHRAGHPWQHGISVANSMRRFGVAARLPQQLSRRVFLLLCRADAGLQYVETYSESMSSLCLFVYTFFCMLLFGGVHYSVVAVAFCVRVICLVSLQLHERLNRLMNVVNHV